MLKTIMLMCLTGTLLLAQDPVKVAAGNYRLIAENDEVRLLEANLAPGGKTVMHAHPALMAVMLQPGLTKWTMPDGKTEQSAADAKRGLVIPMAAQSHISENIDKKPLKALLIEFKKPAPAAAKARKASSVANCKVIAESAHATAQLCTGNPGEVSAKHTHAGGVVYVALTDLSAEITDSAGKTRVLEMKKDAASIAIAETHSAKNTGKVAYQLLVFDLK
jgi:quercetin dioxygenase-like cupin family protein